MHGVSNRDTHLHPPHNYSSVHLTTTHVQCSVWITNGRPSGWATVRDSVLSSTTPAPTPLEWPFQEEPGSGLTTSASVSDVSDPACTNRCGLLCGLWVWRRRTNHRLRCPAMSNPPTSPWTAPPDGFGRWDNRMAAQHLPQDLVRPSSGQ